MRFTIYCSEHGQVMFNRLKVLIYLLVICNCPQFISAQDHLLLSEITLQTEAAEFIEIFNPTDEIKMLEDYYLADNQNYPLVTSIPAPFVDAGDFIVRFPEETYLSPNQVVVVAMNGVEFENHYNQLPDFEIVSAHDSIPDMVSINQDVPDIANEGEGIALFFWNHNDDLMQDVDLMNAGIPDENSEILDKSDLPGYAPDAHTMPYQLSAAGPGFSTKRILLEGMHEIHGGGNGILFDDETSENIGITWDVIYTPPTPGFSDLMSTDISTIGTMDKVIHLFPNPTTGIINFIPDLNLTDIEIQIYNELGALIFNQYWFGSDFGDGIQLDLLHLPQGVYYLSVFSECANYKNYKIFKY